MGWCLGQELNNQDPWISSQLWHNSKANALILLDSVYLSTASSVSKARFQQMWWGTRVLFRCHHQLDKRKGGKCMVSSSFVRRSHWWLCHTGGDLGECVFFPYRQMWWKVIYFFFFTSSSIFSRQFPTLFEAAHTLWCGKKTTLINKEINIST